MEKLKDILYDLSDVIISLIIIAVIFGVVSWKLNDTLPLKSTLFSGEQSETSAVVDTSQTTTEVTVNITMTESADTPQEQTQTTEVIETTTALATQSDVVNKTITIQSGSSGNAIAKQLQRAGIIEDANAFLKVVAKLGVGSSLQIGTFKLSSDMTYEEIALTLAGRR